MIELITNQTLEEKREKKSKEKRESESSCLGRKEKARIEREKETKEGKQDAGET